MMKRIALIGTGGTIAGLADSADNSSPHATYTAGVLSATELVATLPGIESLAAIVPESLFAIDSKDITLTHWLKLAQRLAELMIDPAIDGMVVTHGTDTLEETAWFLHLTLPASKPVVMTCAMRPANTHDADGPLNLRQAVAVAGSNVTAGCGVVVAVHGEIHGARDVSKRHTQSIHAFASPEVGRLGVTDPPHLELHPPTGDAGCFPLQGLGPLPEIPMIDVPGGASPFFLQVVGEDRTGKTRGVVLVLPGNGSLPETWRLAVERAVAQGIVVVRASRTGAGCVSDKNDFPGFAAGTLTPQKARITLMLALASGEMTSFAKIARPD